MNTALSWIKAYVPELSCSDQEYCDAMTMSGTKVENYERLDKNLEKIVIGQIESIEKHPDADKLIVCQVNVGTETIQIVTGAPNVKVERWQAAMTAALCRKTGSRSRRASCAACLPTA